MYNAHLLLSKALCAERDYQGTHLLIEDILPYVSDIPQDRAALLAVLVKVWVRGKKCTLSSSPSNQWQSFEGDCRVRRE